MRDALNKLKERSVVPLARSPIFPVLANKQGRPRIARKWNWRYRRPKDSRLTDCLINQREKGFAGGGLLAQLVEQRPGGPQVGGVEALTEPLVNPGEYRARLIAPLGVTQEVSERGRRTQLP